MVEEGGVQLTRSGRMGCSSHEWLGGGGAADGRWWEGGGCYPPQPVVKTAIIDSHPHSRGSRLGPVVRR